MSTGLDKEMEKKAFKNAIELIRQIIVDWTNHDTENHSLKVGIADAIMTYLEEMLDENKEVVKQFLEGIKSHVEEMIKKTDEEHERVDECYRLHEDSLCAIPDEEENIYLKDENPPGLTRQNAWDYEDYPGFEFEFKVLKDFMSCMKLQEDRDLLMGIFIEHFGEV